jgi:hypothetical protein
LGTGGHFALEDFHGVNHYRHPSEAFKAYVAACKSFHNQNGYGLPDDYEEQAELGIGVLDYYLLWLESRENYETVWIDGEPQVETTCLIPLPVAPPPGYDQVCYQLTLDKLVEIDGEYWILDYKFYKTFSQANLAYDAQMSAYIWGAQTIFDRPIAGAILHEFVKKTPNEPKILSTGKLSTSEKQGTTHRLYRDTLVKMYGSVDAAPSSNIKCLNELAARETPDRDDFIRRTKTRRTELQQQATGTLILMEAADMCNPDLPLYPNPTRDCSWDCSLQDICLMIDRDDDWESLLQELTVQRTEESGEWRQHLK